MTTYIPPPRAAKPSKKDGKHQVYYGVYYNSSANEKYVTLRDIDGHRVSFLNIQCDGEAYKSSIKKEFRVVSCINDIAKKVKNKENWSLKKETLEHALQQYYEDARESQGAIKSLENVLQEQRDLAKVSDDGSLILSEPCVKLVDYGIELLGGASLSARVDGKKIKLSLPPEGSMRSMAERVYELVLSQQQS